MSSLLTVSLALLALYLLKNLLSYDYGRPPLPPGPRRLPFIGNLLDWPLSRDWLTFTKWAEKYGDIVHADVAGTHMIILNSADYAYSLLDEKGAIYSERPMVHVLGKLIGWESSLSLMGPGQRFRDTRRLLQQEMGSRDALEKYIPMMEAEIRRFLVSLVNEPHADKLRAKTRRVAAALVVKLTYGWHVADEGEDKLVSLSHRVNTDITAAIRPGAFLADYIPQIERLPDWFPGTGYRKTTRKMHDTLQEFVNFPFEFVKKQIEEGTAQHSLIGRYLQESPTTSESQEDLLKWIGCALHSGGADTSSSPFYTFFLAMTLYPEVQAKAQAEIDTVIGTGRLPSARDRDQLPFVDALVKEVYRWGSVGPAGLAHRSMQDDFFEGYWIPKGSFVIPNIWRFTRDPRTYTSPESFEPSRFLGSNPERDPRKVIFGFGRRLCPGEVFADESVFLLCASTLATFNITMAHDPTTGAPLIPEVDFDGVTATVAKEFPTCIKPRSDRAEELVRATFAI